MKRRGLLRAKRDPFFPIYCRFSTWFVNCNPNAIACRIVRNRKKVNLEGRQLSSQSGDPISRVLEKRGHDLHVFSLIKGKNPDQQDKNRHRCRNLCGELGFAGIRRILGNRHRAE